MHTDPTAVTLQIETHRARVAELAPSGPVRTASRSWARRLDLRLADWSAGARSVAADARRRLAVRRRPVASAPRVAVGAPSGGPGGVGVCRGGSGASIGARSRVSR